MTTTMVDWQARLTVVNKTLLDCIKGFVAGYGEAGTLHHLRRARQFCERKLLDAAVDEEAEKILLGMADTPVATKASKPNLGTFWQDPWDNSWLHTPPDYTATDDSTGFEDTHIVPVQHVAPPSSFTTDSHDDSTGFE